MGKMIFYFVFYFLLFSFPVKQKPLFNVLQEATHFYVDRFYEKILTQFKK